MLEQSELVQALTPVVRFFVNQQIDYFIGGSVASSHHGASRSTLDVDLTVVFRDIHIKPLIAELSGEYYLSEAAIRDAVRLKSCFNLIHLKTSFKVDFFVSRDRDFDHLSQKRASVASLGKTPQLQVRVATAEDIILIKLQWYRLGNEVSERQWTDLTNVLRLNRQMLDVAYLQEWANRLDVDDLLSRLLET